MTKARPLPQPRDPVRGAAAEPGTRWQGTPLPHVLLAPDKFKGSLGAAEVARHLAAGLRRARPGLSVTGLPVADGGEGTVDALVHSGGFRRRVVTVGGPTGRAVRASFAQRGTTAVVELAQSSGLGRLPDGIPAPLTASSRGAGEVVRKALDTGARTIVLGLGGSACTDGGVGLLGALGARFTDAGGRVIPDGGAALRGLADADLSGLDARLAGTEFLLATDVDAPLLGPGGAAAAYGPQKGAGPEDVAVLEAGLSRLVEILVPAVGPDAARVASLPGAGAAGGSGFGALACLGARRRLGVDVVLDAVGIEQELRAATLVVTGEGSLDLQTLQGKAPLGVARRARLHGVPVIAVCGRLTLTREQVAAAGFRAAYTLGSLEPDRERSIAAAAPLLRTMGRLIAREHLPDLTSPPAGAR
ncbi:glycerate kinase [Embleya scabrispora]|uniref:glycerate kinase n=1 Tax=Embleya scabrispora TaxID=159449 RepID=UPI000364EA91|nr:glycerate kinase [Embleya scabrispora]MYS86217.1 glycerate kinase [Streptomyces sp. SID5474]